MLRHFTPAELVELTFQLMKVQPASKLQVVWGLEPESMPVTVVPPSASLDPSR